jgi:hypothetical protein
MKKRIPIPGLSCKSCGGNQSLSITTNVIKISELRLICQQCGIEEDILALAGEKYNKSKKEVKRLTKELSKTIIKLRKTLPKNKDDWSTIVTNPKHPFTAALLSGLVILMLELSGFGIFMILTWILGNLILNPVGWVLIPIVVAVVFHYRDSFTKNKISGLKEKLNNLEAQHEAGDLNDAEHDKAKDDLLASHFS